MSDDNKDKDDKHKPDKEARYVALDTEDKKKKKDK